MSGSIPAKRQPDIRIGPNEVGTSVAPHAFERLGRIRHRAKCRRCYCDPEMHPTTAWVPARPYGDKSAIV